MRVNDVLKIMQKVTSIFGRNQGVWTIHAVFYAKVFIWGVEKKDIGHERKNDCMMIWVVNETE